MGGTKYKARASLKRKGKKRKGFNVAKRTPEQTEEAINTPVENETQQTQPNDDVDMQVEETGQSSSSLPDPSTPVVPPLPAASLSAQKLRTTGNDCYDFGTEATIFMNVPILLEILEKTAFCPECPVKSKLDIFFNKRTKIGLACFIELSCPTCGWSQENCTSKTVKNKIGAPAYEVNRTSIIAFRECGLGYTGLATFCGMMNMPPPLSKTGYQKAVKVIRRTYVKVAADSMTRAADEVRKQTTSVNDDVVDTTASFDGTWQKRGYVSLNGVVTGMSLLGKCIDYSIKSKVCKTCQYWKGKKTAEEFEEWKATHECLINHDGSAGKMEADGIKDMYLRSIEKYKLRYTTYLGDGDTKSYSMIKDLKPYGPTVDIDKAECVGHVQKRVGTRLRTLKDRYKGKVLSDGKSLGGIGRLTEKTINTLQNYYGMAIRQNSELYAMKKSVAALLHHCSEADSPDERHKYCPRTEDSWCKYQSDKITSKSTYKAKINIPRAVYDVLKDIFSSNDLGSDEILKRCLHGRTQNPNECINNTIWTRCPKRVYVGLETLEFGVCSAVISFNDGALGLLPVFDALNISRGNYRMDYMKRTDHERVKIMNKKASVEGLRRRSKLRSIRKKFIVDDEHKEGGQTYVKGGFHA